MHALKFCLLAPLVLLQACSDLAGVSSAKATDADILGSNPELNDTGVSQCLNATGILWNCDSTVSAGQDGNTGRDYHEIDNTDGKLGFSFVKLDLNGEPLPNQDADSITGQWDCVEDQTTGLVWEVKSAKSDYRHAHGTYSWYHPNTAINQGNAGIDSNGT